MNQSQKPSERIEEIAISLVNEKEVDYYHVHLKAIIQYLDECWKEDNKKFYEKLVNGGGGHGATNCSCTHCSQTISHGNGR